MRAGLMVTARRAASSGSPLPMQRPMCMGSHLVPELESSVKENSTPASSRVFALLRSAFQISLLRRPMVSGPTTQGIFFWARMSAIM